MYRWPLRLIIPSAIFGIGLILIVSIYWVELRNSTRRVQTFEAIQIRLLGSITSTDLESSLRRKDRASAQRSLERIRGDRDLMRAALIDSAGKILLSTHYADRGKSFEETPFKETLQKEDLSSTSQAIHLETSKNSMQLFGIFPVNLSNLPGDLQDKVSGRLVTIHSLAMPLSFARAEARERLVAASIVLILFCALIWFLLKTVFLARIQKLVAATDRIASGKSHSNVLLHGNDELANLSKSLHQMALKLDESADELRRNERHYRSIIEGMDDIVSIIDAGFKFIYVSPSTGRISGYDPEWFTGQDAFISVPEEDIKRNRKLMQQVLSGEIEQCEMESKFEQADGSVGFYHTVGRRMESEEGEARLLMCSRNVTALKHVEHALRESESKFNSLFDSLSDGAWAISADGSDFVYANQAVERIYGRTIEELQSHSDFWLECCHPDDREIARQSQEKVDKEGSADVEYRIIRPDGSVRWIHERKQLIYDEDGNPVRKGGLISDVTEVHEAAESRELLENQLRQTQKMEAIGTLAGGVAHDFNNLLTAINGYSDLLCDAMGDDHEFIQEVREIRSAGDRAAALTRQLLMFSRQEMAQARLIDLNGIVRDLNRMLMRLIGEHIGYTSTLSPVPLNVWADPGQVEQIIVNLVVNARDAMEDGGTLNIRTERSFFSEGDTLGDESVNAGAYARLVVQDTGTGMSEEVLARIFEPFYTTKGVGKGTGLGLATIYGIVKQYSGYIDVKSTVGEGTTFEVYLPLIRAQEIESEPKETRPEILRGTETVLFVEDERVVREVGARILKEQGYELIEAVNGAQALELAAQTDQDIHLVVTDVVMPGMTGRELVQHLIGLHPEIRVLFVSGYREQQLGEETELARDYSFLQKPYDPHTLAGKVRETLDQQPQNTAI